MTSGVLHRPEDPLPPFVLGLDNVSPRPDRIFERMLSDLQHESCRGVFLGCRQGLEAEVFSSLTRRGVQATVRYLGRMGPRDVQRMVALVEPSRVDSLKEAVLRVVDREHLSKTPFTIGLLISVLLRGESLLGTASDTALLDAYVNLLLGRGDPHDDARFSLDSLERADILSTMAAEFVHLRTGSVSQGQALAMLEKYFEAVGWEESPIDVLENLVRRHVLSMQGGQVKFTQTSFLHLFAAKHMASDPQFKYRILERSLYFSPIVQHYAALTRDDVDTLHEVHRLFDQDLLLLGGTADSFARVPSEERDRIDSVELLLDRIASHAGEDEDEGASENDDDDDYLEMSGEEDLLPFPLDDIDSMPSMFQVAARLSLVSAVLRDSELVKDITLKRKVLADTLFMWGAFVAVLEADDAFREFTRTGAESVATLLDIKDSDRLEFIEKAVAWVPVLTSLSCLSVSLSSRKLLRALDLCFQEEDFCSFAPGAVLGGFLAMDILEPGWTRYLGVVERNHGDVRAVREVFRRLAEIHFYMSEMESQDRTRLQAFLVEQYVSDLGERDDRQRRIAAGRINEQFKRNRLRIRRRELERRDVAALPAPSRDGLVDD